jgi:hypothetical protein
MTTGSRLAVVAACVAIGTFGAFASADSPSLTLEIADYLTMPATGGLDGDGNSSSFARVNALRDEPGGRRFFVNDLNGPLYVVDKKTKTFTTYLNFNGSGTEGGLFRRFTYAAGFANGLISFQFDPDYLRNGRFYTVHLEDAHATGSPLPDNSKFPGLALDGYTPTAPIQTPGPIDREAVLIEWTDTNIANSTFEGRARELMRVQLNTRIHPMGDLAFNPAARRGDADWRVLYIGCGDGGSGEQSTFIRMNPQRLDTLVGKILRIVPDLSEHADSSIVSENGRYRIPRDNPFTGVDGARKEIWAYGLRNPHRLIWDVNPASPSSPRLLAATIGLHTWESVYAIRRGANFGYSEREGPERLNADNTTGPPPAVDEIPVRISDTITKGTTTPIYPVIAYPHRPGGGDAIAGGFVYRGKLVPSLRGKFIFGDISTGRIWYADESDLLAAADGKASTLAPMHEVAVFWKDPHGASNAAGQRYPSMWAIASAGYHFRGGKDPDLPGASTVSGPGRVDLRFAMDADGELYLLTKTDGMIRKVIGAK